jgi:hypothetical protein
MKKAALYKTQAGSLKYDRIAEFNVGDEGVVQLRLLDQSDPEKLASALDGITLLPERRTVTARDGELFLEALSQRYRNASRYGFVDESEGQPEFKS